MSQDNWLDGIDTEGFFEYRRYWNIIVSNDLAVLRDKDVEYGGSWKKRGGVGAFMMLARKWDRIEEALMANIDGEASWHDIFAAAVNDVRDEGLLDDIRDLRRYLINVEAEVMAQRDDPFPDCICDNCGGSVERELLELALEGTCLSCRVNGEEDSPGRNEMLGRLRDRHGE